MSNSGIKTNKISKSSSGLCRKHKANQELRKINSKIRRWGRYGKSNHLGRSWDISGLEKRAGQLKSIVALGSSTRV